MVSNSAYVYGANFIAKFRWESGFLGGYPLGHQRECSKKYLGHLSVKERVERLKTCYVIYSTEEF